MPDDFNPFALDRIFVGGEFYAIAREYAFDGSVGTFRFLERGLRQVVGKLAALFLYKPACVVETRRKRASSA